MGAGRGWQRCGPPGLHPPHPRRSLTLPLLQQLPAGPEAGLGSLHAHGLLGQGEDLGEVEGALATPPAPGLGVGPQRWVFSRDVRANAQLVGDVAGALCGGEGGRGARSLLSTCSGQALG